ncbi:MAG: agmatinase [Bacteroidota bacterium]
MVSLLGIPWDGSSSFMQGAAEAPAALRTSLHSPSSNLTTENGLNLDNHPTLHDQGNIDFQTGHPWPETISATVAKLLSENHRVVSLGGDHSITYPILKAYSTQYENLTILHLDAHPDLYDNFADKPLSHASPFARIMENGLASRLIQVGIRTMNAHQQQQADRFGVEIFDMQNWQAYKSLSIEGPVYLSVDLDVLDPAFAPGISHHEPGGLTTRELISIIQNIPVPIVGADLVELNPSRDINGVTAMTGAKILKEILGNMLG